MARRLTLLLAISTACGRGAAPLPDGVEGGPCYGNDTCNQGLSCISGICLRPGDDVRSGGDPVSGAGCGNGVVEPGERCDDGNLNEGDGCSPDCELELQGHGGTSCSQAPRLMLAPIGDHDLAAVAYGLGYIGTDSFTNSCDVHSGDEVYEVVLTDTGSLRVILLPNANDCDPDVAVRGPGNAACSAPAAELECSDNGGTGDVEMIELWSLQPDSYFIIVNGFQESPHGYVLEVTVSY